MNIRKVRGFLKYKIPFVEVISNPYIGDEIIEEMTLESFATLVKVEYKKTTRWIAETSC